MIVTCGNILKLHYLEKMKLVAGEGGLDNVISWVHVVELPEVSDWVKGGEMLFITGVGIKDNNRALLKLVRDINDRRLSGLVINVGPYIKETPKDVIDLANKLNFPIFELPFEIKLIDITQSICRAIFENKLEKESMDSFMREIIFGDVKITDDIINRATLYGYKPNKIYVPLVLDIDNFSMYLKRKDIKSENVIASIKTQIQEIIERAIHKYNKKYLYAVQGDAFFIMISIGKKYNGTDLIETLVVYIEQNRNLGKTAEVLYIHRNTIKYRIRRIEELLECNIKEDKTAFNIMICIEAGRFLNLI